MGAPKFSMIMEPPIRVALNTSRLPNPGWPSEAKYKTPDPEIKGNISLPGVLISGPKFRTSTHLPLRSNCAV